MRIVRVYATAFLGLTLLRLSLVAQDAVATNAAPATNTPANTAAALAEQQGADEQFKRMAADIESLRAANQALTDRISTLAEENRQIRADLSRLTGETTAADQIKLLGQKIDALASNITEVDKKRMDDKLEIAEQISKSAERLEKLLAAASAQPPRTTNKPSSSPAETPAESGNGVKYKIKAGDKLVNIEKAYNEIYKSQGKKLITLQQIKDANPTMDENHLKIDSYIVIPLPPE